MAKIIIRTNEKFAYLYNKGYDGLVDDVLSVIGFTTYKQEKSQVKFYLDGVYVGRMKAKAIEIKN